VKQSISLVPGWPVIVDWPQRAFVACPKCGTPFEVVPVTTRPRPDKRAASRDPEVEAEEVQGAELISLEEADAETQGKQAEAAEDVEADEAIEDDAEGPIIEQEEEEDTDVSEIIGGDIEDEEET
jgi:uncharacterized protein (TIGR02300 family)